MKVEEMEWKFETRLGFQERRDGENGNTGA